MLRSVCIIDLSIRTTEIELTGVFHRNSGSLPSVVMCSEPKRLEYQEPKGPTAWSERGSKHEEPKRSLDARDKRPGAGNRTA